MSVIDTLITDRTEQDVVDWQTLKDVEYSLMTLNQKSMWDSDMKGSYNISDLNRVAQALIYLKNELNGYGYYVPTLTAKTDWVVTDIPTITQMSNYLTDVSNLRNVLSLPSDTPTVPTTMNLFTYSEANDIENICVIIENIIYKITQSFYRLNAGPNNWCGNGYRIPTP